MDVLSEHFVSLKANVEKLDNTLASVKMCQVCFLIFLLLASNAVLHAFSQRSYVLSVNRGIQLAILSLEVAASMARSVRMEATP